MAKSDGVKIVTKNRRAYHDYTISDTYEAGLVLVGSEIKSIRANHVNLSDGFIQEQGGELWLLNVHIATYAQASVFGHKDPMRPRKLLLHKREIAKIITWVRQSGYTAVPTQMYLKNGRAKIEIGLARGKKLYDKRDAIAKRDAKREIDRALKERYQ